MDDAFIRLDAIGLKNHADYCLRERKLAGELADVLARAASVAPPGFPSRTRKLSYEADKFAKYFGKMADALTESGEITESVSHQALELMDEADKALITLLK